ncbi:MAG: lysophospholipase [Clostridiales Family XIII bacterium]|jgi:alpha-beta hydrolase superfamily lysophospholipase|nr:lysophospholipase [Clostridiales Family XIII bacterium]
MMNTKTWMRPASSGLEDLLSQIWIPEQQPKAVLQIAHGMAEHIGRYDAFAKFMAAHGYVVAMNEHAGHGKHAATLGYFSEENGTNYVVQDMYTLMSEVTAQYPDVPVFLMGHSMGSFLVRKYIATYNNASSELSGCILSGTAGRNSAVVLGKALAGFQKKVKGAKSPGKLLQTIAFGSYNKKISNPINDSAWLSTVDEVCLDYDEDAYCGFPFTAGGYYDLFSLLQEINTRDWAAKVPLNLPIYIFSGDQDPVGNYGKGTREVYESLKATNHENLTLKLYEGGRHEMLNEANKEMVYDDVLRWLDKQIRIDD